MCINHQNITFFEKQMSILKFCVVFGRTFCIFEEVKVTLQQKLKQPLNSLFVSTFLKEFQDGKGHSPKQRGRARMLPINVTGLLQLTFCLVP